MIFLVLTPKKKDYRETREKKGEGYDKKGIQTLPLGRACGESLVMEIGSISAEVSLFVKKVSFSSILDQLKKKNRIRELELK